ncbi:hypothetical protein CC85DRAFT_294197 [Cutaneotrichosporon oleaginosum]|uniref:RING-type domain-containing protein n=1 Tax=Cutaneotrichosporon oleaginosum TaxID=879819 RepID=A0A0J1AU28_9TREE|nr:uncharacterized protein CC85DRAFT_294197 [Cutaneotrichosporon oleaginosum]KLT38814.1 hypothetical protein CC85DRAFT_294197 [Cutaneotrichosporon oleaginosum]TXT06204.1 hypothetical protein COLE_05535 [Cutaneotrichosporon oleaginosum]
MTIVHFVLWLIGSAVCFAQLPTVNEENCYDSAPLLWWPLMLTTIIFGWLHAVYYALVVVGASIILVVSGIYLILAHFMGWPVRPILGMHRPRTPQPETLTEDDLKACPIVAYIPDPNEPLPEPSIYAPSKAGSINEGTSSQGVASAMLKKAMGIDAEKSAPPSPEEPKGQPVAPGEADPARLGLPGVVLSAHQVTCAICQSSFLPPREVFGKEMYLVERLRQLPCKHVFHVECVDNWLVNHSGICPYCSQNVKDMIETKKAEAEDASPSGGAAGGAAPHRRGEGEV